MARLAQDDATVTQITTLYSHVEQNELSESHEVTDLHEKYSKSKKVVLKLEIKTRFGVIYLYLLLDADGGNI